MEKYNKFLIGLIVVTVLVMTIGYSVLNSDLKISGEVNYRAQDDVRITSFTTDSKPDEMTIQYSDYSKHEVKLGYTTTGACSITYTVEVKNSSGVNMGILEIYGLDDNVEVQENIIGTKLVGPASTQTFTITFSPSKDEIKTYLLTFDFKQVFTITYNGFSGTENFKKEILEGDDYSQNFGSSAPTKLEVTMGGVAIENYTYSNGTLTILNVNGNIEITAPNACEFPSYTDSSGANAPILNGDMIPVVYSEECKSWIKQDLDKSYDYDHQKWANAVTISEDSKRAKSLGVEAKDLINSALEDTSLVFKSTNQGKANSTSSLTLVFDATSNGKISFDWRVSSEKYDKLTITVTINGQSTIVANGPASSTEEESGKYESEEITAGSSVKIVADFKKDASGQKLDDTAYIENLTAPWPAEVVPTGNYPWSPKMDYLIDSTYDIDVTADIFSLKNVVGHSFNSSDIGKYMCSDGSTSCSELYKITKVEGNVVKEVEKYTIEQFKARETYKEAPVGTVIPMSDINTMWVWIPRYSYTIKSIDGTNYYGKATYGNDNPTRELPGEIDVKFIKDTTETGMAKYIGDSVDGWRTNEAFNFDGVTQAGMWVGKFEVSGSLSKTEQACVDEACDVSNITIKPGISSIRNQTISSFFYMARSIQIHDSNVFGFSNNGNLHMMKNDEWGAVAYLSQSRYGKYGNNDYTGANKEVYINNNVNHIAGYSGGSPNATRSSTTYEYDNTTNLGTGQGQVGPGASTTGNIYGIYDMSGGTDEYVMGILEYDAQGIEDHNGQILSATSGFKGLSRDGSATGTYEFPEMKYYNKYKSANPADTAIPSSDSWILAKTESACDEKVCYGHALSETYGASSGTKGWYNDNEDFVKSLLPWFSRGGSCSGTTNAGIFYTDCYYGSSTSDYTCRLTLTP